MGNIGDPMGLYPPAVGTPGPTYASDLVAFLDEVQLRLEAPVPLTSLLPATFDMDNNPIENVEYLELYEQASAPTTPVGSLQKYGGDLWYVSSSGAVQLTDADALAIAGVGAITGDYGGVNPAQFRFVDADKTYYAYDDYGLGEYANVWVKELYIAGDATGAERVKLDWIGSGASFTITLPAALPAATYVVQMDNAGQLTVTNTLTNTLTAPDYKFTTAKKLCLPAGCAVPSGGSAHVFDATNQKWDLTGAYEISFPVPLCEDDRITGWSLRTYKGAGETVRARLYKVYNVDGTVTALGTEKTSAASLANVGLADTGLSIDVDGGYSYFIRVWVDTSFTAGSILYGAEVTYTRP